MKLRFQFLPSGCSSFCFVAVAVVLLHVGSARTVGESARKEIDEMERIVGGENATKGQFPWTAALHHNGRFICTASIISINAVLTAAHCVVFNGETLPAREFYGIASHLRSHSEVRINFASVTVHPEYSEDTITKDLAVFRTTEPILMKEEGTVEPICLARPETDPEVGQTVTAMGWGNTKRYRLQGVNIPENLQYTEQMVRENEVCAMFFLGSRDDQICADNEDYSGICQGDSGGPLVKDEQGTPVLVGVASHGSAIFGCTGIAPSVWARPSSDLEFIAAAAKDPPICVV